MGIVTLVEELELAEVSSVVEVVVTSAVALVSAATVVEEVVVDSDADSVGVTVDASCKNLA